MSESDSSVCNLYLLQSTYLVNSPKVKASAEKVYLWCKHKQTDVCAIYCMSFINDCLQQLMLHVSHPLLQFADITDPLLSTAALLSRFYGHRIQI